MQRIAGPEVWHAAEVQRVPDWRFELDEATVEALADAARVAVAEASESSAIDRRHFWISGVCRVVNFLKISLYVHWIP